MPNLAVLVAIGLAAFRLTRLVTNDSITKRFRDRLYTWAWDDEHTVPSDDGYLDPTPRAAWRTYLHELLTCPYCFGVWVSVGTYLVWDHGGDVGHSIVAVAAVAGAQAIAAHVTSLGDDT